ncbi:uncharacterized protein A4U43_C08F24070 [Asparagus officinalis]|nr:uncharacterized protein A4U43_C08F24070 [Asparagus officinalis]
MEADIGNFPQNLYITRKPELLHHSRLSNSRFKDQAPHIEMVARLVAMLLRWLPSTPRADTRGWWRRLGGGRLGGRRLGGRGFVDVGGGGLVGAGLEDDGLVDGALWMRPCGRGLVEGGLLDEQRRQASIGRVLEASERAQEVGYE